jgi:subtilisin family serine protease
MTYVGVLRIENGESRVEGRPLAVLGGEPTSYAAATTRVQSAGLKSGDRVSVTAEPGYVGERLVLFMSEIIATPGVPAAAAAATRIRQTALFDLSTVAALPAAVSPDLDPRLQWWLARRQAGQVRAATSSTQANEIAVVARVTQPGRWEELSEVRTPTRIGKTDAGEWIVTGRIPIGRIEAVRGQTFVKSLKASQTLAPQLSATTSEIGARDSDLPTGHRATGGSGTIVGVIDYGGDFAHENFRRADGATRLLALWNQDAGGPPASPFGYGREFLPTAINLALQQSDPYAALGYDPTEFDDDDDPGAHGTHVMDIAAGNGRGTGVPGVAPEADLIFVNISHAKDPFGTAVVGKSFGDSVRLLEAAKYIFDKAGSRPCVVNVSLGTNGGPHDGTTLVEQGLDSLLAAKPNRALVVAAANAFADGIHAAGRVAANGSVDLRWQVLASPVFDLEFELWYKGQDRFTVELVDPSGVVRATVAPGQNKTLSVGSRTVLVANRLQDPNNGDNMIGVFLSSGIAPGTYIVRLRGDVVTDGRFHAWIERDDTFASQFAPPHDNSLTIGSVSCSRLGISVGSYDAHKASRPLSFFSSAGPTRDDRKKPEVAAPGHNVRAALSGSRNDSRLMSGTSMASPAVAGVVALMFDEGTKRNRKLSAQQVQDILIQTARRNPPGGAAWDPRYGHGRVNAAAAVKAVIDGPPPGGGGTAVVRKAVAKKTAKKKRATTRSAKTGARKSGRKSAR